MACSQYLKKHPEFLVEENDQKKEPKIRIFNPHGGEIISIAGVKISLHVAAKVIINYLAREGIAATFVGSSLIVLGKIPEKQIALICTLKT